MNSGSLLRLLAAAALALPLSHIWFTGWLNGFAYHIEVKLLNYLLVLFFTVLLVLPIVTLQLTRLYHSKTLACLKEE